MHFLNSRVDRSKNVLTSYKTDKNPIFVKAIEAEGIFSLSKEKVKFIHAYVLLLFECCIKDSEVLYMPRFDKCISILRLKTILDVTTLF